MIDEQMYIFILNIHHLSKLFTRNYPNSLNIKAIILQP
jgi:hypothetical protein